MISVDSEKRRHFGKPIPQMKGEWGVHKVGKIKMNLRELAEKIVVDNFFAATQNDIIWVEALIAGEIEELAHLVRELLDECEPVTKRAVELHKKIREIVGNGPEHFGLKG